MSLLVLTGTARPPERGGLAGWSGGSPSRSVAATILQDKPSTSVEAIRGYCIDRLVVVSANRLYGCERLNLQNLIPSLARGA